MMGSRHPPSRIPRLELSLHSHPMTQYLSAWVFTRFQGIHEQFVDDTLYGKKRYGGKVKSFGKRMNGIEAKYFISKEAYQNIKHLCNDIHFLITRQCITIF